MKPVFVVTTVSSSAQSYWHRIWRIYNGDESSATVELDFLPDETQALLIAEQLQLAN